MTVGKKQKRQQRNQLKQAVTVPQEPEAQSFLADIPVPRGVLEALMLAVVLLLPPAYIVWGGLTSPDVALIQQSGPARWIAYPQLVSTDAEIAKPEELKPTVFTKTFTTSAINGETYSICARAMRTATLKVNDAVVLEITPDDNWKKEYCEELKVTALKANNQISVEVVNPRGPPLVYVYTRGLAAEVKTDITWSVAQKGKTASAELADDTRQSSYSMESLSSMDGLRANGLFLLLAFLFCGGAYWLVNAFVRDTQVGIWMLWGGLGLAWLVFWSRSISLVPVDIGYDAIGHLNYIIFLLAKGELPLATDGWSMYHPPLFYVLSSWAIKLVHGAAALNKEILAPAKVLPHLCGMINIWCAFFMARFLFRKDLGLIVLTTLCAALIPMNIYIGASVSNETLHGALSGVAILLAAVVLGKKQTGTRDAVLMGLALGMAFLTKYTVVLIAGPAIFLISVKWLFVERQSAARTALLISLLVGTVAALAGWFYLRNMLNFGTLLVGNWNLPGESKIVLQFPGFHTPEYYLRFGESLRHPFFSGLASFWDGVYATFWGDAYVGGRVAWSERHSFWNYHAMASMVWLGLPAMILMLVGFGRAVKQALFADEAHERLPYLFLVVVTILFDYAMIHYSLKVPAFSTAKAFFALALVGTYAIFMALGVKGLLQLVRFTFLRALVFGWLGMLLLTIFRTYANV